MYNEAVPNRSSPPAILRGKPGVRRARSRRKPSPISPIGQNTSFKARGFSSQEKKLAPAEDFFRIERSIPYGHVEALLAFIRHLGVEKLISSTPSKERDLVLAMIVERILPVASKLAFTRYWHATTLAEELQLEICDEDDLYEALDWLLELQGGWSLIFIFCTYQILRSW